MFIYISKLNTAESANKNDELETFIEDYLRDKSIRPEEKWKLIDVIENELVPSAPLRKGIIEPSSEYERLRRRVYRNTQDMWNQMSREMMKLKQLDSPSHVKLTQTIDAMIDMAAERKNSLLHDLNKMAEVDGYEAWRFKEASELSGLMQRRLHHLQNPEDCGKAPKLVCPLEIGCGYGCELHHVVYCFIMAYATERTLILTSKGWRYHKAGWEEIFRPISDTCVTSEGISSATWSNDIENVQVVHLPLLGRLDPRPQFLPQAIPADLAPRLKRLHGDPFPWWVGQFLKYLLRPQPETQNMLDAHRQKLGFQKPIVGVHVRRTDKVRTQAVAHNVEEYMIWVEDYFDRLELSQSLKRRRVFLASDDPSVFEETRKKYPKYEIIGDVDVASMASLGTRYSDASLNGIISDIHLLSMCDYVVCTFSSQVCRTAYEIMQTMYPDASNRFKSLDSNYYFCGQGNRTQEAVMSHRSRNKPEVFMNVNDTIRVIRYYRNGLSEGLNLRTNKTGLYSSFKVENTIETANFPQYSDIKYK